MEPSVAKIMSKSKEAHEQNIKTKIMIAAFQNLKERQIKHSKVEVEGELK